MEKKKTNKANLEKTKTLFFIVSLGIVFAMLNFAFNYDSVKIGNKISLTDASAETNIIPITRPPDKNREPPIEKSYSTETYKFKFIINDTIIGDTIFITGEDTSGNIFENYTFCGPYIADEDTSEEIIYYPDKMPSFPGGIPALLKYISENIRYKEIGDIEETVYLVVEITKTGKIGIVNVLNKNVDEMLQKEAVRVIKSLPEFKPGIQNGKPVNVWFSIPVSFKLY